MTLLRPECHKTRLVCRTMPIHDTMQFCCSTSHVSIIQNPCPAASQRTVTAPTTVIRPSNVGPWIVHDPLSESSLRSGTRLDLHCSDIHTKVSTDTASVTKLAPQENVEWTSLSLAEQWSCTSALLLSIESLGSKPPLLPDIVVEVTTASRDIVDTFRAIKYSCTVRLNTSPRVPSSVSPITIYHYLSI
jgi:hypothetical protein